MSKSPNKTSIIKPSKENTDKTKTDLNEKLGKIISFKNIGQKELEEHLNLIKKWLKDIINLITKIKVLENLQNI